MKTISAADANRHFSRIMREVEAGETYVVTSRGKPRMRMEAVSGDTEETKRAEAEHAAALKDLLDHLASQPALNLGKFDRNELYDD